MKTLQAIQKNLIIAIPIMMVIGFSAGLAFADASFLKHLIIPFTILMVYPMMINLPLKKIFEGGDAKVQTLTQIINFAIIPFIAFGIGIMFFSDQPYLAMGILLMGLIPTSGMTISWTGMAKGNMTAAIKMTVFGLLLGAFLTPLYINFLMDTSVKVNTLSIFMQIIFIVIIPLILGNITQRLIVKKYGMKKFQSELKPLFPPFSTLGVLGIVFVAMALKAKDIYANPEQLLTIVIPLVIFYVVTFIISASIGKTMFKRGDAIALLYGTVVRNLSVALAIAITAFGDNSSDVALVIALAYILQVQVASWSVKLISKIYGPVPQVQQKV